MLDKKLTRKQFIVTIASFFGLFLASKIPKTFHKDLGISNKKTSYGKGSYGG